MAFSPLQTSFAAGEVSPRLRGRSDSDLYRMALAECLNFEVLPGGALRKAGPTRYVANLLSGGSRLIPFQTSDGLDYVLELGNLVGRIYTTAGRSGESGGGAPTDLVANGSFSSAASWTLTAPASISGGKLRLDVDGTFDPDLKIWEYDTGEAAQVLNVVTPGDYLFDWDDTGAASVVVVFTWAGGSAHRTTPGMVNLPAGAVTLSIGVSGGDGDYALIDNVSVILAAGGASFELVTPWTLAQLPAVQWVMETGADRIVLVHGEAAPFYVARDEDGIWTHGSFVFTWKPPEWVAGPPAFWPDTVEIHAGRLWMGRGRRLWASRVGALDDFRRFTIIASGLPTDVKDAASQVTPECGLDVTVSTKASERWLKGARTLLLGTDQGEHYVVGSNGPPRPGDIDVLAGSAFGSASVQAAAAGDQVLYVSADRRRLRAIGWELQADGWVSHDLTWYAEHLTRAGVRAVHFAKAPYPAAVLELADGTLAICCYDRAAQQLSWWRREIGGGEILSACVTDGAYGSILWLSVLRGATACLEYLRLDDVGEALLDGHVEQVLGADLTVTGLAHLEGAAVEVVIDRTAIAAVVAAGAVVLSAEVAAEGDVATVGIPYLARAKTLPLEGGNPRGSAQASKRRFPKVRVRLNASALPKVNGYRAAERSPATPMDQGQPAFTGDVDVATSGWEDDGQITIEQDLPLRTEVLSLGGVAQVNQV